MSRVTYHTFYTDNIPNYIVDMHKEICKKFDVKVEYHVEKLTEVTDNDPFPGYRMHGECMDHVMKTSTNDVVGFLDIDCLPLSREDTIEMENYATMAKSFIGNAQNISHLSNRNLIYAAASYLVIHKSIWKDLGEPSLRYNFIGEGNNSMQIDTAMDLTIRANYMGYDYQLLLPTGYSKPTEKPLKLGPYGWYGIGTFYPNTWHLLRVSEAHQNEEIRDLWLNVCSDILDDAMPSPLYKFYPYRLLNFF